MPQGAVVEALNTMRALLGDAGFGSYQEEEGSQAVDIEVLVGREGTKANSPPATLRLLILATDEFFVRTTTTEKRVGCLVGGWTWKMLLLTTALAVFDRVYHFARHNNRDALLEILTGVKREMAAARNPALFLQADLRASWVPRMYMMDASKALVLAPTLTAGGKERRDAGRTGPAAGGTWTDPRPAKCHILYLKMKMLRVLAPNGLTPGVAAGGSLPEGRDRTH